MDRKRKYTEADMQKALEEIKEGCVSIHKASVSYQIPRGTLQNRLHARTKKAAFGPSPILTEEEEQKIVDWLMENQAKGFPRRKHDIQAVVKGFLDAKPRENPFIDNLPGEKWYQSFLRRHPRLTVRTPEAITDASANVSEANLRKWFEQIRNYLVEKNLLDCLNDPNRIWNGDETNFLMCPKGGKVLASKGSKNIYEIDRGAAKENLTVMFTFAASGSVVSPMIIYPYKRIPKDIIDSVPGGIEVRKSDSGWMTSEVFLDYIENIFHPALIEFGVKFPVIIFVDGHRTHVSYEASKLCKSLNIVLVCLYPNSTRILQPAGVSIFKPLKNGWTTTVHKWRRENLGKKLSKPHFATILKEVTDKFVKKETIINGFRACGLYPFDANSVDYSKCLGRNPLGQRTASQNTEGAGEGEHLLQKSITYDRFKELVGEQKIEQLKAFSGFSEDFLALHKIFIELTDVDHVYSKDLEQDVSNMPDKNLPIEMFQYDEDDYIEYNVEASTGNILKDILNLDTLVIDAHKDINIEDMPVDIAEEANVQIIDFLPTPQTPVRAGTKKHNNQSYIISSTPFQKAEETKIENKARVEKAKHEKQEKKAASKLEKQNRPKDVKIKKKKPSATITSTSLNKMSALNTGSESHVRFLFQETSEAESNENTQQEISFENLSACSGLCYECARSISRTAPGINCFLCGKSYHETCASKLYPNYKDFSCKICYIRT